MHEVLKVWSEGHLEFQFKAINDKRLWSFLTIHRFAWVIILQGSYSCHHCHNYHHQSSRYASGKSQGKMCSEIITFTQEKDGEALLKFASDEAFPGENHNLSTGSHQEAGHIPSLWNVQKQTIFFRDNFCSHGVTCARVSASLLRGMSSSGVHFTSLVQSWLGAWDPGSTTATEAMRLGKLQLLGCSCQLNGALKEKEPQQPSTIHEGKSSSPPGILKCSHVLLYFLLMQWLIYLSQLLISFLQYCSASTPSFLSHAASSHKEEQISGS